MSENEFEHLPPDLQEIARALEAHPDVPDGHLLERVWARVSAKPKRRRTLDSFLRGRLAALSMLLLCVGLNVSGAMAAVLQACGISTSTAKGFNLSNLFQSLTTTVSTGSNWHSASDDTYCDEGNQGGSDTNHQGGSEQNGGSDQNKTDVSVVKSTPMTKIVNHTTVTTYTQTTTTTTHNSSEQNGSSGSENNGQCQCPPSTSSGSDKSGGSENVQTKVDTYQNNRIASSTTTNSTRDGDQGEGGDKGSGGSEQNNSCPSNDHGSNDQGHDGNHH